ncbi:MAG: MFS transporter [Phycisphaerales bacterium]|nr:MFS transporter [Phycisphaerales bacterium]
MPEQKPGFIATIKSYPRTFWVANTMEIFERMSWYGWFTVMALYVTGTVETGGLGFTTETRGMLQAVVPCILYFLPVVTGALADRFGFKRTFIIAYTMMIAAYYLLGQFTTLPTFFMAFLFVAVAAATFKPVVVGTVAKVTDDSNSAMAFGIFYMMVNIGGFVGPIVAGLVRGWGWKYVFVACAGWAAVNLFVVIFFYREPRSEQDVTDKRTLKKVGEDLVEVLGNLRFFITVGTLIVGLMIAGALSSMKVSWFSWDRFGYATIAWLVLNFLYDLILPKGSGKPAQLGGEKRLFVLRRMHCSNWRFALFLLIMSGFWTSFNQIFYTMPEYIRDFTNTRPLIAAAESVFGKSDPDDPNKGVAASMATVNKSERRVIIKHVANLRTVLHENPAPDRTILRAISQKEFDTLLGGVPSATSNAFAAELEKQKTTEQPEEPEDISPDEPARPDAFERALAALPDSEIAEIVAQAEKLHGSDWRVHYKEMAIEETAHRLIDSKVRLTSDELQSKVAATEDNAKLADRIIIDHRQINPEFIVNLDSFSIICFQVLISFLMARFHRFTTMIVGMVIAAVGIGLPYFAADNGMLGTGGSVWIVMLGIFVFAIGEMMASPTSQEYVGRIAPRDKIAMYMGYYFVAVALGNLFGGIISGELYGKLARDMGRPDLMWAAFGGIMLATAIIFLLYNQFALPRHQADSLTGGSSS